MAMGTVKWFNPIKRYASLSPMTWGNVSFTDPQSRRSAHEFGSRRRTHKLRAEDRQNVGGKFAPRVTARKSVSAGRPVPALSPRLGQRRS